MSVYGKTYRTIAVFLGIALVCFVSASSCGCASRARANGSVSASAAMTCVYSYNVDSRSSVLFIRNESGGFLVDFFIVFWCRALDSRAPDRRWYVAVGNKKISDPVLLFLEKSKLNTIKITPGEGETYQSICIAPEATCNLIIHDDLQEQFPKSNSFELYAEVSAIGITSEQVITLAGLEPSARKSLAGTTFEKGRMSAGNNPYLRMETDTIFVKLPPKAPDATTSPKATTAPPAQTDKNTVVQPPETAKGTANSQVSLSAVPTGQDANFDDAIKVYNDAFVARQLNRNEAMPKVRAARVIFQKLVDKYPNVDWIAERFTTLNMWEKQLGEVEFARERKNVQSKPDQYIIAVADPSINPEVASRPVSNDPDFLAYQSWQEAKRLARTDLKGAIAKVEETIHTAPDLSGDAYFVMAQCMEYSMEIPLFINRDNPQISGAEVEKRFNMEFDYYQKAIDAYGQPGARTLLGITRDPGEQIRKIRDVIIGDKKKILNWWLERLK